MTGWNLDVDRDPELIGGPQMLVHYPRGWGMASNTPFRLYKSTTHAGGVRVPLVVSWPAGIPAGDRGTSPRPVPVRDRPVPHDPRPGRASPPARTATAPASPPAISHGASESTHLEQYSECFGNRSFYRDGWKLVALHQRGAPYDDGEWELYDITADPTEVVDLAAARPDKVRELADGWESAAWGNQVFPLDDGTGLLQLLRRPDDEAFHREVRLLPGTPTLERYRSQQLIAFRDFTVDVELDHGPDDEGVLVAHGDQGGGYVLYVEDGELHFAYNHYGEMLLLDGGRLAAGPRTVSLRAVAGRAVHLGLRARRRRDRRRRHARHADAAGLRPVPGHRRGDRPPLPGRRGACTSGTGRSRTRGGSVAVTYRPGPAAPYDPQHLVEAIRAAGRAAQ